MKLGYQFLGFVGAALVAFATPTASSVTRRATVCNGHAELCDRSFGSLTYVGTHNSYAIGSTDNFAVNQGQSLTRQLDDGVRMLQMQAHNEGGVIKLCHTLCALLDGGTLEDYLKIVKSWLDANPNEVLSLLIVNIDNIPVANYGTVFERVGLDAVSYAPPSSPLPASEWPTLGALIDSGKRLITFLDNAANPATVPYIIDEFTNIWETAFNVLDPAFDCAVNRTKGDTGTQMYLINHFLDTTFLGQPVPDVKNLNRTNAADGFGSLGAHVDTCVADHGKPPNFLLVDFYEFGGGSVFEVAAKINGVPYSPTTPVASPNQNQSTATQTSRNGAATNTSNNNNTSGTSGQNAAALPLAHLVLTAALTIFAGMISAI